MGLIFDISWPDGLHEKNVAIPKGMATQVRWDLRMGSAKIQKDGQVTDVIRYDEHDTFEGDLTKFTGYLDSNMGRLYFQDGKHVGLWLTLWENAGARWLVDKVYHVNLDHEPETYTLQTTGRENVSDLLVRIARDLEDPTSELSMRIMQDDTIFPWVFDESVEPRQLVDPYFGTRTQYNHISL